MPVIDAHWQGITALGPVSSGEITPWTTYDVQSGAESSAIVARAPYAGQGIAPYAARFTVQNGWRAGHSSGFRTELNQGSLSTGIFFPGDHHFGSMGFLVPDLANFNTNGVGQNAASNSWAIIMQYHPKTTTSPDFLIDLGKGRAVFAKRGGASGNQNYVSWDIEAGGGLTRNVMHQVVWEITIGPSGMLKVWHRIYPSLTWDLRVNFTGAIGTNGGHDYPKIGLYEGTQLPHTNFVDILGFRAGYSTFAGAEGLFATTGAPPPPPPPPVQSAQEFAHSQLALTVAGLSATAYPHYTGASGAWTTTPATNWTAGFLAGALWEAFEATADTVWRDRARASQAGIESDKTVTTSHDLGFKFMSSFANDFRLTGDATAKAVALQAALSLDTRWSAAVGMIRARDTSDGLFESIVDTLANLELLYWSAANTGPAIHATHATAHALKAITNLQRVDGSTYHVAHFNETTGALVSRGTIQGFSDASTWARGQAWAIYGLATAYGYTANTTIRDAARLAIAYWMANVPSDKVPFWDLSQSDLRDTSAGAIAAVGMLRMAGLDAPNAAAYNAEAAAILTSLKSAAYLAQGTTLDSALAHGVSNKPNNVGVDVGLIYGDYFFQRAMLGAPVTPDPPPPGPGFDPAPTSSFGAANPGTVSTGFTPDRERGSLYTSPPTTVDVIRLGTWIDTSQAASTQGLRGTIRDGATGTLLAVTPELLVGSSPAALGIVQFPDLASPLRLSPSTSVRLGIISGLDANVATYMSDAVAGALAITNDTYSDGPASALVVAATDDKRLSIYAEYVPVATTGNGALLSGVAVHFAAAGALTVGAGAVVPHDRVTWVPGEIIQPFPVGEYRERDPVTGVLGGVLRLNDDDTYTYA